MNVFIGKEVLVLMQEADLGLLLKCEHIFFQRRFDIFSLLIDKDQTGVFDDD